MNPGASGPFDAHYLAFLETITQLRPKLHRYCARMTGSIMDGEDVVQEALFNAYRRLETLEEGRAIAPWLFQIAHNRAIDFIRRRDVRAKAEVAVAESDGQQAGNDGGVHRAIEHLVLVLPPKERACVLLTEALDYSLEETAAIIGSTAGAVKSALHRARAKLAKPGPPVAPAPKPHAPELAILRLYVERFNRKDWDGVRELIAADANLLVADRFLGPAAQAPYFSRYAALADPWRFEIGAVDGELALITMRVENLKWIPQSVARAQVDNGRISRIVDFRHCAWILPAAQSLIVYSS
ncbi:MAG TPA: sigma-70 family RNA polymerase sigma factor [Bryobacteraceae bacterium]|jgi:RNA polymerase sigma-70 factor (ECF subfamily)